MKRVTKCHLCSSKDHKFLFRQQDLFHSLPGEFSVWKCQDCGLVFLNPRPTVNELMDFYPASYVAYTKPLDKERKIKRMDRSYGLLKRFKFMKKFVGSGNILDVGCATGAFLTEIHKLEPTKWNLYGLEPNKLAASIAQQASFIKVSANYLKEADYPNNFFDVVTMWDVLEHVHSPIDTLREVRRILKPRGMLVFSTPNLDSWDATIFKKYWVGYDVPRHIHVFDNDTLQVILRKTGFIEQGRSCVAGSYFYFISSVLFFLRSKFPRHRLSKIVKRYHTSILIRLAVAPFFWLADSFNKSTTITLACKASQDEI